MGLTAETLLANRPLVPADVAQRWGCSERHVRNLVKRGALRHFYVGGRLLRIPADAVEEYEQCQAMTTASGGSMENGSSPGGKTGSGTDTALMRALARRPNGKKPASSQA